MSKKELLKAIELISEGNFYLDFIHEEPLFDGSWITKHVHHMEDKKDKDALITTIEVTPDDLVLKYNIIERWVNIIFRY